MFSKLGRLDVEIAMANIETFRRPPGGRRTSQRPDLGVYPPLATGRQFSLKKRLSNFSTQKRLSYLPCPYKAEIQPKSTFERGRNGQAIFSTFRRPPGRRRTSQRPDLGVYPPLATGRENWRAQNFHFPPASGSCPMNRPQFSANTGEMTLKSRWRISRPSGGRREADERRSDPISVSIFASRPAAKTGARRIFNFRRRR